MRRQLFLCLLAVLQIAQVTANTAVHDSTFSIAITDRVAGKISCSATISFETSAGGALNASSTPADKITLSYPAGFFATSATPTASISGISIIASSGAATSTSIVLTLESFSYISSNTAVTITLSGLTMGAATAASPEGIFLQTTTDQLATVGISSGAIGGQITAAAFFMLGTDRVAAKSASSITFVFRTTPGGFLESGSTISIMYPQGFIATSATPDVAISGGSGTAFSPTSVLIVITTTGSPLNASTAVTVTLTGLTMGNATQGSADGIKIKTSADQIESVGVATGSLCRFAKECDFVSQVSPHNFPSSGSIIVTVLVIREFGTNRSIIKIGGSGCTSTEWKSETSIICLAVAGTTKHIEISASMNLQMGNFSNAISYNAPVVSGVGASNAASSGGRSVTVVGSGGLGMSDSSVRGRAGASGCAGSVWLSDSGLVCRICSGLGDGAAVVVSTGAQGGSLSAAVSYDAVSVSGVGASNVASSGAASVTVVGSGGFGVSGVSAAGRVGGSACVASVWLSDSGLVCRAGAGYGGGGRTLEVSVVMRRGSLSAAVSYDAVSVSGVGVSNVASSGAASVTVVGRGGAGMSGASSKARVGLTACDGSVWLSDSGLVCRSASGRQAGERVVVSSGGQHGSVSVAVSYNAPVVSGVGASNAASSGGRSVTVVGSGGLGMSDSSVRGRAGASGCAGSVWLSDSGLVCRICSGLGDGAAVVVSTGAQGGSLSAAVSYDAVSVSGVGASNVASSGAASVTVVGSGGFGVSGVSAAGRVGGSACVASVWLSDSGLVCRAGAGYGGGAGRLKCLLCCGGAA
jgi:fibronectin-binding autotransporter adhesin